MQMATTATVTANVRRRTVAAEPLAAMRIVVSSLWLYELARLVPWRSYLYPDVGWGGPLLGIWIVATVCLLVGFRPRVAALVSLLCFIRFFDFGVLYFRADSYAHLATFYLVFIDSGRCWSVDARMRRRAGGEPNREIPALPVLAYLLHLGISYFDVGLNHLLLNDSWRQGFAVAQSLLQPSAGSQLGATIAETGALPTLLNWFTIAYEVGFLPAVALYVANPRRVRLRNAVGVAGIAFHLGITLFYRLGIFGPLMMAMVLPLLPIKGRPSASDGDDQDGARSESPAVVVAGAIVVLTLALVTITPVLEGAQRIGFDRLHLAIPKAYPILDLTGDNRPNNIFSDGLISRAFSIETESWTGDGQPVVWPLLFDAYGRRAGVTEFYPVYSYWLRVGLPMATSTLGDRPFPEDWQQRLRRSLTPVIERERAGGLRHVARVDVFFRAWTVPESANRAGLVEVGPRIRLASVTLRADRSMTYEFCAPQPAFSIACRT